MGSLSNPEPDEPLSNPTVPASFLRDSTEPLDPAKFDLNDFIAGVRPTRRTVALHTRADLVGEMDELAQRIDGLPDGPQVDQLIEQYELARQGFLDNTTYWTVERRSGEWVKNRWAAYASAHGIKLDKDGDTSDLTVRTELVADQLVGQIVSVKTADGTRIPGEVTHEQITTLRNANEGEYTKLLYAMGDANRALAQEAKVLTRDFSPRSSTSRSGTAS